LDDASVAGLLSSAKIRDTALSAAFFPVYDKSIDIV